MENVSEMNLIMRITIHAKRVYTSRYIQHTETINLNEIHFSLHFTVLVRLTFFFLRIFSNLMFPENAKVQIVTCLTVKIYF